MQIHQRRFREMRERIPGAAVRGRVRVVPLTLQARRGLLLQRRGMQPGGER